MIFHWTATLLVLENVGTQLNPWGFPNPRNPRVPKHDACWLKKSSWAIDIYMNYMIYVFMDHINRHRYCNKYTINHSHCSYKAAYSGWYWWLQACDSQKDQGWLRRVWPPRAIERMIMMMGLPMDYHICSWWWLIKFNYQWVYQWIMMIIWVYPWVYQW